MTDLFSVMAIKDTYKNSMQYAKTNYKYLTELSLVLNYRLWMHDRNGSKVIAKVYDEIWHKCHNYVINNMKGEEFRFYDDAID